MDTNVSLISNIAIDLFSIISALCPTDDDFVDDTGRVWSPSPSKDNDDNLIEMAHKVGFIDSLERFNYSIICWENYKAYIS